MAIQVSGTTVIDNSRVLQNIVGANGAYDNLQPTTAGITNVINFNTPMMTLTMGANTTLSESNKATGHSAILILDRSSSGFTPTWSSNIKWPTDGTEPAWADHRYWIITFICISSTLVRSVAIGYDA